MGKTSKGSRLKLGEPHASNLADFCAAHYGAPEIGIIREALKEFIEARLAAEPEVRKRFESARNERLGRGQTNLHVLKGSKD